MSEFCSGILLLVCLFSARRYVILGCCYVFSLWEILENLNLCGVRRAAPAVVGGVGHPGWIIGEIQSESGMVGVSVYPQERPCSVLELGKTNIWCIAQLHSMIES